MKVVLTGTGNPAPLPERGGTGIYINNGEDPFLIDCGPGTVHSLIRSGINPEEIKKIFFTHYHMDHIAGFFHFVGATYSLGRQELTIYGPEGTEDLHEGFYTAFESDIEARKTTGVRPPDGLTNIKYEILSPGDDIEFENWEFETLEVDHVEGLQTYAYRIEEKSTGDVFVFSGDTRKMPKMETFARNANILVHDASENNPYKGAVPKGTVFWEKYAPRDVNQKESLSNIHTSPEEAAEIAENADVDTLVLTHLRPYRDTEKIRKAAEEVFGGYVVVAEDGLQMSTANL